MTGPHFPLSRRADLIGSGKTSLEVTIDASEEERARIAAWLDVPSVESFRADLTLTRWRANGVAAEGTISGSLTLICGVSLKPFTYAFTGLVSRRYLPEAEGETSIIQLDPDAEDAPDPLPRGGIDAGALAAEELSLLLPDHPRAPGAELPAEAASATKENPFAVLARLKKLD